VSLGSSDTTFVLVSGAKFSMGFWQIISDGWLLSLLRGTLMTVVLSISSMLAGLVLGVAGGMAKWARIFPLTLLVDAYTTVIRGVPELLVIFLIFFGSVQFVGEIIAALGIGNGIDSAYAFIVAVCAIGVISGAYLVEVVRSALGAIPKGHLEAAQALGLGQSRTFWRIIAPQMIRIAVPGINNVWQSTTKDTALVSVIGLQELMRIASIGANVMREPLFFFLAAAALYLLVTIVSQGVFNVIERAVRLNPKAR
jgi:octopine/nopaline transport system permease protein